MTKKEFTTEELERALGAVWEVLPQIDPRPMPGGNTLLQIVEDKDLTGSKIEVLLQVNLLTKYAKSVLNQHFDNVVFAEDKITFNTFDVPVEIKIIKGRYDFIKFADFKFYRPLRVEHHRWVHENFYYPNPMTEYLSYIKSGKLL